MNLSNVDIENGFMQTFPAEVNQNSMFPAEAMHIQNSLQSKSECCNKFSDFGFDNKRPLECVRFPFLLLVK